MKTIVFKDYSEFLKRYSPLVSDLCNPVSDRNSTLIKIACVVLIALNSCSPSANAKVKIIHLENSEYNPMVVLGTDTFVHCNRASPWVSWPDLQKQSSEMYWRLTKICNGNISPEEKVRNALNKVKGTPTLTDTIPKADTLITNQTN
jgi:hypothetical protein